MQNRLKKLWRTARSQGLGGCYTLVKSKIGGGAADRASGISVSRLRGRDSQRIYSAYKQWSDLIPLPPASLMFSVGAPSVENFLVVGDAWAQLICRYLKPEAKVLDIGCGCGRTARFLTLNTSIAEYIGFDVIEQNIGWCERFIVPVTDGRFSFHHFDLFSEEYNQQGKIRVADFSFPATDNSIDLVFAASLFTHLREPEFCHYLGEISRVLQPDSGKAVISIHTNTDASVPFKGTETRIDIEPGYFYKLLERNGLLVECSVGEVCGQGTYLLALK